MTQPQQPRAATAAQYSFVTAGSVAPAARHLIHPYVALVKEALMQHDQLNRLVGFIWNIADDVLRDLYVRGKYRDVILPMTVLRRLDAALEPTKGAVLRMKTTLDDAGIENQDQPLREAAGQDFYNTSVFTLRDFSGRNKQQQLRADFTDYLDGFSPNGSMPSCRCAEHC